MHVVLTGATGFVGRHLLAKLATSDATVTVVARAQPPSDLNDLVRTREIRWLETDLSDAARIAADRPALAEATHVVALAARTAKRAGERIDLSDLLRDNVVSVVGLIERLPSSLQHFCYVSTLDVYGPARQQPIDETHPTRPQTEYGASKLAAEQVCAAMLEVNGCPLAILRLAHVYGPGENAYDKVIPVFVRHAVAGQPLEIAGDGADERDFVYVGDVADGILRAIDARVEGTFNIASGKSITMLELAETVARLVPGTIISRLASDRPPSSLRFDISRAVAAFQLSPTTSLSLGLSGEVDALRKASPVD